MNKEKHILLVEDNMSDELLTTRSLKKIGIINPIVVMRDGAEALAYLENEENALPELVMLDLKLPKISGLEVLKRLRQNSHTQLLPIVIFTSSDEEKDIIDSYQLGANSYVQKPVDFAEFSAAVHDLGMYWLVLNKAP